MKQFRPLIMRSNRFLGSVLSDKNLISAEDLDAANAKLLEFIQAGEFKNANLLNILVYDMQVLEESKVIETIVEESKLGLIDLSNYEFPHFHDYHVDPDMCWATFTLPYEKIDDFYFVATAYYLSQPVVKHWEDQLDGQVIWYATTLTSIFNALGKIGTLEKKEEEGEAAAAEEKKPAGPASKPPQPAPPPAEE